MEVVTRVVKVYYINSQTNKCVIFKIYFVVYTKLEVSSILFTSKINTFNRSQQRKRKSCPKSNKNREEVTKE